MTTPGKKQALLEVTALQAQTAELRGRLLASAGDVSYLDPEAGVQADAKPLEAEEESARQKMRLSFRPQGDGTTRITGLLLGPNLSATDARRLACTAQIIPAGLGNQGEILDLGRADRLYRPAQRRAMRLRDKRCRVTGCTCPATWCEAHHLKRWTDGGLTNIDDGILVCPFHHHRLHDPRYEHETIADGDILIRRKR